MSNKLSSLILYYFVYIGQDCIGWFLINKTKLFFNNIGLSYLEPLAPSRKLYGATQFFLLVLVAPLRRLFGATQSFIWVAPFVMLFGATQI